MPSADAYDPKSVAGKTVEPSERAQVLVIGAGRAGLTAALAAAQSGLSAVVVDENPVSYATMGEDVPLHYGQGMSAAARNGNAAMEAFVASEPLIEQAFESGVDLRLRTACWGLYSPGPGAAWLPGTVAGLTDGERSWLIGAEHVIVAAGRRDIGLAFPGWDKPGVMGATAARMLAARYGALEPRRVVLLGTTAEALEAALAIQAAGGEVVAVVEQATAPVGPADLVAAVVEGGAELLLGHVVREVLGASVEAALVSAVDVDGRAVGEERRIPCDGVVLGVGAVPVIDLLDALGCATAFQPERGGYAPVVGPDQRTSIRNVFAVGDCAGIWAAKSRDLAVADAEARRAVAAILGDRGGAGVEAAPHAVIPEAPAYDIEAYRLGWVRASVVEARGEPPVCQCEDVTARELVEVRPPRYLGWTQERRNDRSLRALLGEGLPHPDQVKRLTRAGMGPCQGRRCREQVACLLALQSGERLANVPLASHRAPVRPIPLASAGQLPEAPAQAEHWDSWFGMHAQWTPFWETPARYTVATGRGSGPVASE